MTSSEDRNELHRVLNEILGTCKACTLATIGDGKPWAASVFFTIEGTAIYCIVENRGQSMANLKKNPDVALAIDNRIPDRFVQAYGLARVVQGEEETKGRAMVIGKVPEYKSFFEFTPNSIVKIDLKRIHITDITRGWFPAKVLTL